MPRYEFSFLTSATNSTFRLISRLFPFTAWSFLFFGHRSCHQNAISSIVLRTLLFFLEFFFIFPGKPVHYTGVSFTSFFYVFIRLSCAYLYLGFAPLSFNLFMIHEWYYYLIIA